MIALEHVVDTPMVGGTPYPIALDITMTLPVRRYAVVSPDPIARKPAIDLFAGLRPPSSGRVVRGGSCSWPIGRAGFVRGKLSGRQIVALISRLYHLDYRFCIYLVESMLTLPEYLDEFVEHWPATARQELGYILPLLPTFDIYVVDGTFPYRKDRFTLLWRALFEQRIDGRTLLLSTVRKSEVDEFCDTALILNQGLIEIESQLDEVLRKFPLRPDINDTGRGQPEPLVDDQFA